MHARASAATVVVLLALVMGLAWSNPGAPPLTVAAMPPNSPYTGTGSALDVHEFARNDSATFADAKNDSTFSYASSWYPSGYRGYQLHAEVGNLRKTVDPVPNGDIDHYDEPDNNWTLIQMNPGPLYIVSSIDNTTGGNPGYCLNATLTNGKPGVGVRTSYIDNNFTYASALTPDSLTLSFDIKYSSDVTSASWLIVEVAIFHNTSKWSWSRATDAYKPTSWTHNSFPTGPVNGNVTLRITIQKTSGTNPDIDGSIAFDNLRYDIGSYSPPREVDLTINGAAFVDTGGSGGTADIYADPTLKERAPLINCWNTTEQFQFNSTYTISFNYKYSMYIKRVNPGAAITFFTAPADADPSWVTNYTIPGGRPPLGYEPTSYRFGFFLPAQWVFSKVKNGTGHNISTYSYDVSSRFFLLNENVGATGDSFSVYASTANYVLQVHAQRGPTPSGPWTNITAPDYFVTEDYLRVFAELLPIGVTGNTANVSVFLPDSTLWRSDSAPTFDADRDTLTSVAWQMPVITEPMAGDDWLITVSFNTVTQCGMRTQPFAACIEPKGTLISPVTGSRYLWGNTVSVNVTWQNNATLAYITGAAVRVHYFDRYSQPQYATMSSNGQGAYFTSISTSLSKPSRAAQFDVEFFKAGYINASYAEGTHLPFTINLVNDLGYEMVRPVQSIGPNEYLGQTTANLGYTVQAKLYDPFEVQYARNDTAPWTDSIRFNCSRYEDTGSGWVLVGADNFVPNSTDPTLFEKIDTSYSVIVLSVKYAVTARLVSAACEYQQQNFTVIIEMVAFASNLDALRTSILYPPSETGDGWTVFNTPLDNYQVHLYSSEILNITVYYENTDADLPISDASVDIFILGSWLPLANRGNGYYNYTMNTLVLGVGLTHLQVNASRVDCAAQAIIVEVVVERRTTLLTKDLPSSTVQVTFNTTLTIHFDFRDTVPSSPILLPGATIVITGYPASSHSSFDYGNGTYTVIFFANISRTVYPATVNFSHGDDYQSQSVNLSIEVVGIPSQLDPATSVIDVTWGDTFWVVVYYNDTLNNRPIDGAAIQYEWGPLSGTLVATGIPGWYNISLPTAAFTTGTQPLNLTVSHGDYANAERVLSINIAARPTLLTVDSIEASYPAAGVIVPLSDTRFSVPRTDVLVIRLTFAETDGTLITDATALFSWQFGTISLVPVDDQYLLQLDLATVPLGSYLFSIQLSRPNYVSQSLTSYRLDVTLVPTAISGIDDAVPQVTGQPFDLVVHFDDTYHGLGITGANVTITIASLRLLAVQMADTGNGSYTLANLAYTVTGIFPVEITAQGSSLYAVAQRRVSLVVNLDAQGSAVFTQIALALIVAVVLLGSGFLAYSRYYRPRVLAPRRLVRKQKIQDVADMFSDVVNLSRFLVLHRGSGIAIFDPFSERGMDAALFGGFLQAISAFAVDVARDAEDEELPRASPLHEITYEGFRILIHDGRLVRTALVFKGQPGENLKKKMEAFTTRFEAQYSKELGEWCCEPEAFQDATGLLEEIFHVSLLLPHKVQPKLPNTASLTPLEAQLHGIAMALTQKRDSVLLQELIQAYSGAIQADKLEVFSALSQLREKKLLVPIEFYRLTKKAREELAPEPKTPK